MQCFFVVVFFLSFLLEENVFQSWSVFRVTLFHQRNYWLCNEANKMFFGTLRILGLGCILVVVIWYIERKLRLVVVCILVDVNVQ